VNTEENNPRTALRPPWPKGVSGNPRGRPKNGVGVHDVRALARRHGPEAFQTWSRLMRGDDPRVAVRAAEAILDRAYGKPVPEPVLAAEQAGFTVVVRQYLPDHNGSPAPSAPLPIPAGPSEQVGEPADEPPLRAPEVAEPPDADVHIVVKHFTQATPADAHR
jgi:hypothetical protein